MANFDAVEMPAPLGSVSAGAWQITTNSECGIPVPGLGPGLTALPLSRARADQQFPEGEGRGAAIMRTYLDDFYYRMHVLPSYIDVGNLTEKALYGVEIFNAWLEPVDILEITASDSEGLALSGFFLPETVLALTSVTGSLLVGMDGPAAIAAKFAFAFSKGDPLELKVEGSRIVTFSIAPDWSSAVKEKISYWTDVLESRDGTEQRIRMRRLPRWGIEYGILESGERVNLFDSMLAGWGARTFLVPVWWMKSALERALEPGESEVMCDTADRGFKPGGMAVVWQDALKCEAAEVLSVSPGSVLLSRPAGRAYEEGYLVPARLCRMAGAENGLDSLTSSLFRATVSFEAELPEDVPPAEAGDQIDGKDVFPFRHDWSSPRNRKVGWSLNLYDSGTGLPIRTPRRTWPTDSMEAADVLFGTLAEANAFKAWLARAGGRAGSFWALIEEEQLLPTRGIESGANLLYVGNAAYGLLESETRCRNRLFLKTSSGERLSFGVTSYQDAGNGEFLLFTDATWPKSVPLEQIARIGFVVLARFDQDDFEIERRHDTLARTSLALKGTLN